MTKTKTKADLVSCEIPALMADAIDRWLELPIAKQNKIFSRTDFITRITAQWFKMIEKDFDIHVGLGKDFDKPFLFPEDKEALTKDD
jgi:hypothetical protein